MDKWISKCRIKYESYIKRLLKRSEIQMQGTTWINPGNVMLSKISQSGKDKYYIILLT